MSTDSGFLNINKPTHWTSHDVVAKIRGLLGARKVGHTGTLDPMATGVLPICVEKATKVAQFLLEMDKEYHVVMRLGVVTNTQDATGVTLKKESVGHLIREDILKTVKAFQGSLLQMVPMYSAVKVKGEPLYKAARQKREVEQPSRRVIIYQISVFGIEEQRDRDVIDVAFDVTCSKGTYMRTLCADMGEQLGVGGHLLRLERRRSGPFHIDAALSLEEVQRCAVEGRIKEKLIPIEEVLLGYPNLRVVPQALQRVIHGGAIGVREIIAFPEQFKIGQSVLVYNDSGELIAMAAALMSKDQVARDKGTAPIFKVSKVLVQ